MNKNNSLEVIKDCTTYIKNHLQDTLTAESLASRYGYSLYHFCHIFKICCDMSPGKYIRLLRLEKAKKDILSGMSITQAGFDNGFETSSGFSKAFRKEYGISAREYLKQNKGFIKEKDGCIQVSTAAILLFGRNPQNFFPRARIRFIKYEGTQEKFGTEMNVIKDVIFKGTILDMINNSIKYLDTQVKEKTYLGANGKFVTEEEYPKFVRQELIVNAVTHRAYSISGTDIQIKMFDNRIVVESPGKFPGLVKTDNMRFTHFSRNPKIAEFLKAYKL